MDLDPYSEYGSGSRKLLKTDLIRIRIHNTAGNSYPSNVILASFPGEAKFKLHFTSGGAIDFGQVRTNFSFMLDHLRSIDRLVRDHFSVVVDIGTGTGIVSASSIASTKDLIVTHCSHIVAVL